MAKRSVLLLPFILASALAGAQVLGTPSGGQEPNFTNAFLGSSLACSQQQAHTTILVPGRVAARAKLKARLLNLLRDSIYDDARGIVNIGRENEIKKLANKLRHSATE